MLFSAHNRRKVGNRGVVAYKVNALMFVMGATETCRNADWLCANMGIINRIWCVLLV